MRAVILSALIFLLAHTATAAKFSSASHADGSTGVKFSIGYTAGTHKGTAGIIKGSAVLAENDDLQSARFEIPVDSFRTGNTERDCHLVEGLTIDYTASVFPKEHVCGKANNFKLPAGGPNSSRYPNVIFEFVRFDRAPGLPLKAGEVQNITVSGNLQIHGVTKRLVGVPAQVQLNNSNGVRSLRILTQLSLGLSDFNIQIKPFKILFASIGVSNVVNVNLDLVLNETK